MSLTPPTIWMLLLLLSMSFHSFSFPTPSFCPNLTPTLVFKIQLSFHLLWETSSEFLSMAECLTLVQISTLGLDPLSPLPYNIAIVCFLVSLFPDQKFLERRDGGFHLYHPSSPAHFWRVMVLAERWMNESMDNGLTNDPRQKLSSSLLIMVIR